MQSLKHFSKLLYDLKFLIILFIIVKVLLIIYLQKLGADIYKLRMHNTYLKPWTEFGVIGLLFFVGDLFFSTRSYYVLPNGIDNRGT